MAPVQELQDIKISASLGATAPAAPQTKHDRNQDRRGSADNAATGAPLDLGHGVVTRHYPPSVVTLLLAIEALAIFAAGYLTAAHYGIGGRETLFEPYKLILCGTALLFPIGAIFEGSFAARARGIAALWGMRIVAPLAVALFASFAGFAALFPNLPLTNSATLLLHWVGSWFVASYLAAGLLDSAVETLIRRRERQGKTAWRVVVYGGGMHCQRFIDALMLQPNNSARVAAFFDDRAQSIPNHIAGVPFGGGADELIVFVQREAIDEIFIALPWSADNRVLDLLRRFRPLPLPVRLAPESTLLHPALIGQDAAGAALTPVIRLTPLSPWGQFVKSSVDRLIAAIALLCLSPLLAAIAVAVKLTSRGPVLFRQQRLGFNNRPFSVYKFRSMRAARTAADTLKQAKRDDSRVTAVGAFIRRWSLDELPQLLNVLRGDMSLVGPRPHPIWRQASDLWDQAGSEPLDAIIQEYATRHRVKPGITGWAQISGYRGETATIERMHKRVELDIYYIDHWSLWFDFKIIMRTFLALCHAQGAY
ncbi:MAG TPA: exopolysaccharide biosynthesis polyprenyl glycosylphosphotransferase [Stellaceae bacterium]|nr:exopolysaccharide biosynthesis polyprenyl glycosylphosphotransferase [Stellaceae bacterium]